MFDELAKSLVHVCRPSSNYRGKAPDGIRTTGSSPRLIRASPSLLGLSVVVRNQEGWVMRLEDPPAAHAMARLFSFQASVCLCKMGT